MPGRPFVVPIALLRQSPGLVAHVRREGVIGGLAVTGASVPDGATVAVDATLAAAQDTIVVTATVRTRWVGECRRCLGEAAGEVEASTREVFEPVTNEEESYRLRGDRIDLEPLARDIVLLGLPPAPVCNDGCLGLCSICGANRNEEPCVCDWRGSDPRWAVLETLRAPDAHPA